MRIIAGSLRRRKLLTNPGMTTRPIIDRAKVMLFDYIRGRLPDARVADLFCGTGTLGFESLSRGAKSVVFAEQDHRAHELLVKNSEALGVAERSLCWRVDVLRSSFKPKGEFAWTPYHVVFFDPPYALIEGGSDQQTLVKALHRLARPDVTAENALLVVRVPREAEASLPAPWSIQQVIDIASMRILLAGKEINATEPPA